MSQHYLGPTLDLHCGGVDLVFPHHEDEIAQSEAASGKPFARFWLHGEFLTIRGTKMSKRYGNFLTARDLKENGVEPAAVRYLFGQTHYRKQLDWTDEALEAAGGAVRRLDEFARRLLKMTPGDAALWDAAAAVLEQRFAEAMDDDLNTAAALASLMDFVREGNSLLDRGAAPSADAGRRFRTLAETLQVLPGAAESASDEEVEARSLAEQRAAARMARDWTRADELRKVLLSKGFDVRDTKDGGFELRRVS
jgi:cysteinyl-tRNA synthetase